MPPKGSEKTQLPEWVEKHQNGDIRCLACRGGWIHRRSLIKHQQSASHQDSLKAYEASKAAQSAGQLRQNNTIHNLSRPEATASGASASLNINNTTWVSNDIRHLDINGLDHDYSGVEFSAGNLLDTELSALNMNTVEEVDPFEFDDSDDESTMPLPQRIIQSLNEELIDIESIQARFQGLKQTSNVAPYETKTLLLLDLLDNIPRLRLSTEHMKLIMWVMKEAGCPDMPTFNKLRQTQQDLRNICGIKLHQYRSSQGNMFEMLDIPELIGRDLSNPVVAPHLVFYPEDSGNLLSESWQAEKWKDLVPLEQLTPMYADGGKLYYVNELARLHNGALVIPFRWITRNSVLTADCWPVKWVDDLENELGSGLEVDSDTTISVLSAKSTMFGEKMPNPLRQLAGDSEELLSCFIKPWCDDVSGGRTKQYQPHNNIYVAHANLPGHLLNQEYFVRFVSTATHASSLEQFDAVKKQLDANNQNPIRVYNSVSGRFVRLRIFILNLPADNRAQSDATSHVSGGNLLCRKCNAGGTYQEVETADKYIALYAPGKIRTRDETVAEIWQQLETACLGVAGHVSALQTETGTKDPTAQDIIIQLIQRGRQLRKKCKSNEEQADHDAALVEMQTNWLKSQPSEPFNILFQIYGLDPHRDTPVEILHTILLGIEKYAWHGFNTTLKPANLKIFETRLQCSNILALEIDPIRAAYIINYRNSLIGRHLKMLMQLTVFHAYDLVERPLFALIKAVGDLGAVLWYSEIHNLDSYLNDLQILVDNLLDTFAEFDPRRIITKMKLHMLTHLVDDIRNHGPAVRFSTEIFECYNGVFRMCSILSNHQAPSQDIARKMIELERFRHIISGGFWETPSGGLTCASVEVRQYFRTNTRLQTHLGWVAPQEIEKGKITVRSTKHLRTLNWKDTVGGKAGISGSFWEENEWHEGESLIAVSGDTCKIGSWVVAKQNEVTIIGRIEQVLMHTRSQFHGIAIISRFQVAAERHRVLGMPVLMQNQADNQKLTVVSSNAVDFAFNVQHDCLTLCCPNSGVERVRQERLNTTIERQTVDHRDEAIFVINMHALHNAQRIREVLPRDLIKPVPLRSPESRQVFLTEAAKRTHVQQKARREELEKKRKAAREARETETLQEEHP